MRKEAASKTVTEGGIGHCSNENKNDNCCIWAWLPETRKSPSLVINFRIKSVAKGIKEGTPWSFSGNCSIGFDRIDVCGSVILRVIRRSRGYEFITSQNIQSKLHWTKISVLLKS